MSGQTHGEPAVRCTALSKRFGDVTAVHDVTLDVPVGEILALLGPSGCGKTTFLRLLAGFERPHAGAISLGGETVASEKIFVPPERRRVGLVFQDYALFPHMTVAANVGYGLPSQDRAEQVKAVLELVGLQGLGARQPHELSGGQQQRVALARALAPGPELVLLDEPFSNLDAALRTRVRSEVREILRTAGATALFVTHDQEEALSLADRVAIMRDGRLHQVDTPELVYTRPADTFVASFVGGANLVPGRSDGRTITTPIGSLRPPHIPGSGDTVVIVRPESIRIRPNPDGCAVVTGTTFYGHDQVVDVSIADGFPLRVRLGPGRYFVTGDPVDLQIVGDEVLAFPAEQ